MPKTTGPSSNKLIDNILTDFKSIHNDCKRKYPQIKEVSNFYSLPSAIPFHVWQQ